MNRNTLRHYEFLIYFCIGLFSTILFFLGTYVVTVGTFSSLILNLSSEFLGAAMIFFIVNRMTPYNENSDEDKVSDSVERIHQLLITRDNSPADNTKLSNDIEKIHQSLTNINQDITKLTRKITSEIDKQQGQLLKVVSDKFSEETQKSNQSLRKAIEEELKSSLSQQGSQNQTVERLVELIGDSIKTMGSFHRLAIEEESRKMFADMLQNIGTPAENLSSEVKVLQQQVQEVQKHINLPALSSKPQSSLNLPTIQPASKHKKRV